MGLEDSLISPHHKSICDRIIEMYKNYYSSGKYRHTQLPEGGLLRLVVGKYIQDTDPLLKYIDEVSITDEQRSSIFKEWLDIRKSGYKKSFNPEYRDYPYEKSIKKYAPEVLSEMQDISNNPYFGVNGSYSGIFDILLDR